MSVEYLVEPDLDFINQVVGLGGDSLKKCFQCATCSVVCPISPENKPFPRKEMIAASWGLKDKLVGNMDIWLCHNCGDCSTLCPRGANPGDVLGAIRSYAISEYATPKKLAQAVNDPKKLPLLIGIPAIIFFVLALITTMFGDNLTALLGELWTHGVDKNIIAHTNFISTWFVDLVFVPLSIWCTVIFALGLKRFLADMYIDAVTQGKVQNPELNIKELLKSVPIVLLRIIKHEKFNECGENQERTTAHMMVLFSFISLLMVTGIFFFVLYLFHIPGPYHQYNPVKILANIAGISLIIGSALLIKNRLAQKDQVSAYKDWYLIGLVLGLGLTGMATEMARLAGSASVCYFTYYIHLIFVFNLIAFLPFSKMAHFVYRTIAMIYAEYAQRQ